MESKDKIRTCYTCNERPAYERSSYCGKCLAARIRANKAKHEELRTEMEVNMALVHDFAERISRSLIDLENAADQEHRRYLRTSIDRETGDLAKLARRVIKKQLK